LATTNGKVISAFSTTIVSSPAGSAARCQNHPRTAAVAIGVSAIRPRLTGNAACSWARYCAAMLATMANDLNIGALIHMKFVSCVKLIGLSDVKKKKKEYDGSTDLEIAAKRWEFDHAFYHIESQTQSVLAKISSWICAL